MIKYFLLILLTSLLNGHLLYAQDCECIDQLEWLIITFEKNDAGFQYVVDKKGKVDYMKHNETYRSKAEVANNKIDCGKMLYEWTTFFRTGHLGIKILNLEEVENQTPTQNAIRQQFKNREKHDYDIESFKQKLENIPTASVQGIWKNGNYIIGITKDNSNNNRDYIGFIMQADSVYWLPSMIKLELKENDRLSLYDTRFFMQDHSEKQLVSRLLGNNYLKTGDIFWKRIYPKYPHVKEAQQHIRYLDTKEPIVEKINENTTIVRIPTFGRAFKKHIDSVLLANHSTITTTKNLIIDVRNNGGGSDASYYNLLPYIYTNPISTVGVDFLSTLLNNKRMKELIKDPNFSSANKLWFKKSLKKLNKNIGEFVNLDKSSVSIQRFDTIYPFPARVSILINEYCGSTTEEFLLAAKQSSKVKLYGKTTSGVLDFSNQNFVNFPCDDFELVYSITKSKRLPQFPIDGIGIQPDYLQTEQINDEDLIQFAVEMMNSDQ